MAYIRPLWSVTVFSPGIGNAFPGGTDKDVAGRPFPVHRTAQTLQGVAFAKSGPCLHITCASGLLI